MAVLVWDITFEIGQFSHVENWKWLITCTCNVSLTYVSIRTVFLCVMGFHSFIAKDQSFVRIRCLHLHGWSQPGSFNLYSHSNLGHHLKPCETRSSTHTHKHTQTHTHTYRIFFVILLIVLSPIKTTDSANSLHYVQSDDLVISQDECRCE